MKDQKKNDDQLKKNQQGYDNAKKSETADNNATRNYFLDPLSKLGKRVGDMFSSAPKNKRGGKVKR